MAHPLGDARPAADYNKCMGTVSAVVSVEEYLRTSFSDGDREYVDGRIIQRNLGERDHSRVQRKVIGYFIAREKTLGTYCFPEQRVQVRATRFRVPDVCVYIGDEPTEQVFRTPPFLAVEILSKDDRDADVAEKITDYLDFGVRFVWIIDPAKQAGRVHTAAGSRDEPANVLWTEDPDIRLTLDSIFD